MFLIIFAILGIEIDEVDCLKPAPTLTNFDVTKSAAFKR